MVNLLISMILKKFTVDYFTPRDTPFTPFHVIMEL